MENRTKSNLGLCILAGLAICGAMLPVAVKMYTSSQRTVDVKGLCEKEVKADKVIWPISYTVVSNDVNNAYTELEKSAASIMSFLESGGITKDEITVGTARISDKYANEYGNNDRVYRFLCHNVITVCSNDVDKVITMMARQSELFRMGVSLNANTWENQTVFSFEGLNDIKPAMIEEATVNARRTAEKFAKDSGSRLGKIKTAGQGTFTITDRDSNTPYMKEVRVVTSVTYYLQN